MNKHLLPLLLSVVLVSHHSYAQPANDNLSDATLINSFPFMEVITAAQADAATLETNERICGNNETWWYIYTPSSNVNLNITAEMSNATVGQLSNDIRLGVYTAAQATHPMTTIVACHDDNTGAGFGENVTVALQSGTTYYFQIATSTLANSAESITINIEEEIIVPVELLFFEASQKEEGIILYWTTASELNNVGFELEHSENGKNWKMLGFTKGNGTTINEQHYQFIDDAPMLGINYYRLKQLDHDGQFEYSPIISVLYEEELTKLVIFPNPTSSQFTFQLPAEPVTIQLYDALTRLVHSVNAATATYQMDVSDFPAGVYWVKIEMAERDLVTSVVIE